MDFVSMLERKDINELAVYVATMKDVNAKSKFVDLERTLLQWVVLCGWYEGVCFLCKVPGMNINAKTPNSFWTAVAFAICSKLPDMHNIVHKLLEQGAILSTVNVFTYVQAEDMIVWIEAQKKAIAKCKRACLTVLWIGDYAPARALKQPLRLIAEMLLKSKLKRVWY